MCITLTLSFVTMAGLAPDRTSSIRSANSCPYGSHGSHGSHGHGITTAVTGTAERQSQARHGGSKQHGSTAVTGTAAPQQ